MKKFKEVLKGNIQDDKKFQRALEGPNGVFVFDMVDSLLYRVESVKSAERIISLQSDSFDISYGKYIYEDLDQVLKQGDIEQSNFDHFVEMVLHFNKATITDKEIEESVAVKNRTLRKNSLFDLIKSKAVQVW